MKQRVEDDELNQFCDILDKLHGIGFGFVDGETNLANMITLDLRDTRKALAKAEQIIAARDSQLTQEIAMTQKFAGELLQAKAELARLKTSLAASA